MGTIFKVVVVSITIAIGSLLTAMWTGITTEEDVQQWKADTSERIHSYITNEMGQWVAQQSAPIVSSGLTLIGLIGYTLLFRKNSEQKILQPVHTVHTERVVHQSSDESDTVKKSKARILKSQLISDKLSLQAKQERITQELLTSESTEHKAREKMNSAERHLKDMQNNYDKAAKELETIKSEHKKNDRDLQAINEEIAKLNVLT